MGAHKKIGVKQKKHAKNLILQNSTTPTCPLYTGCVAPERAYREVKTLALCTG
jgi:hypothetical protein